MKNPRYVQTTCSRDLTSASSFAGGMQEFKYEVPTGTKQILSKSFLQYPTTITVEGGSPKVSDGVALAIDPIANCYQYCQFLCNDVVLYELGNGGFASQEDVLRKRTTISRARRESVYNYTENFNPSLDERIARISYDGQLTNVVQQTDNILSLKDDSGDYFLSTNTWSMDANGQLTFATGTVPDVRDIFLAGDQIEVVVSGSQRNTFTVSSRPTNVSIQLTPNSAYVPVASTSLSASPITRIRNKRNSNSNKTDILWEFGQMIDTDIMLPPGNYSLRLFPYASNEYKRRMVETKRNMDIGTGPNQFDITISNVYLYVALINEASEDAIYTQQYRKMHTRTMDIPATTTEQNLRFDLPSNTTAVSLFCQSALIGSDTRYSASRFILPNQAEKTLTQFNIQYKSMNSNEPKIAPEYILPDETALTAGTDTRKEFYRKCFMNSNQFWFEGGCENFDEWSEFGQYYYHEFLESNKNENTSAQVYVKFATAPQNARMYLVAHTKQEINLEVIGGKVKNVSVVNL